MKPNWRGDGCPCSPKRRRVVLRVIRGAAASLQLQRRIRQQPCADVRQVRHAELCIMNASNCAAMYLQRKPSEAATAVYVLLPVLSAIEVGSQHEAFSLKNSKRRYEAGIQSHRALQRERRKAKRP